MTRPISLGSLIDTFVRLFPQEGESRMVVQRAGMDDRNVEYSSAAAVNWTNIVGQALRQNALDALVDTAAELYPELLDEMRAHVHHYRRWAKRHASTPEKVEEVAAQPASGWLERARVSILSWSAIALVCFAFAGALARESRHLFLGLPGSHLADLLDEPHACATEGGELLWRTVTALFDYIDLNPIGVASVAAAGIGVLYFRQSLRRLFRRAWTPRIVVPLLVILSFAKMYWYDRPSFYYTNVLAPRNWARPELLDVRQPLTRVTQERWRAVVCSRIANLDTPNIQQVCGSGRAREYAQDILGVYVLDVFFTTLLCVIGIAAIRKLALPSQRRDWNWKPGQKRGGIAILAAALLLAVLPVPWTWSRTVRPTQYPMYWQNARRVFRICPEKSECYLYRPGRKLESADPLPPKTRIEEDDVLTRALEYQIARANIVLPSRGPRFAGP